MASTEYAWPRRSSLTRSPDTLSPVYPDRPIRPLPKNRLKSRLSPEQTAGLIYPPDPPISSLSFNFPFGGAGGDKADARSVNGHGHHYVEQAHCTCGGDHEVESEEEEVLYDHPNFRVQSPVEGVQQRRIMDNRGSQQSGKPAPPASIASSADGYESFENTSNKKKRKIPLSGSSGVHQSSLTSELASMGISSHSPHAHGADGANDDAPSYSQNGYTYSAAAPGMGHAGAGRGRSAKTSPIRRRGEVARTMSASMSAAAQHANANSNANANATANTNASANAHSYPASVEQTVERGGAYKGDGTKITPTAAPPAQEHKIISTAIANAQSQPTTPQKGKENVSLLSQSSPKSATPKTQFTFTCESDSSNKMVWPGQGQPPYASPTSPSQQQQQQQQQQHYPPIRSTHPQTTQGTQTGPPMRGGPSTAQSQPQYPQQHQQQNGPAPPPHANSQPPTGAQATPPPKPRRRRPSREYALAARNRRLQQEYTNYHHKPTKENMWICEFCEYEDLFGRPPEALIRQYEIKDRAERKRQEEKRRLLEKAKMKGRKGKKGTKGQKNAAAPVQQNGAQGQQQHQGGHIDYAHDGAQGHAPHGQQDEYYDDEYDEGYDPVSPDEAHQDGSGRDTGQYQGYDYTHGPPQPPDKAGIGGPASPEAQAVAGASV